MNQEDAHVCGNETVAVIRLQPVEWVEEAPFTVTIRQGSPQPANLAAGAANKYGKPDFGIFHCRLGGGVARFRRRRWFKGAVGGANFHELLGVFAGCPSLPPESAA
jgi:hypothetical protein